MKKSARKIHKIFALLIAIMITAITLAVGTYAWFTGLSTASTGDINIAISSAEGLDLSLNGEYWTNGGTELKIKDANHTYITETGCSNANCAYSGNKNIWPEYLNPVSTIGELDTTTSRLKLFEKQSLIANPGGYYITSQQVQNAVDEGNGYVAFDLFIRNGKGSAYNGSYNMNSEEDIYLSADSFATTLVNGNQPDYGAANSVRVGFFEIGRMSQETTLTGTLRNIKCTTSKTGVTPLCVGSSNMTNPNNSNNPYTLSELQANTWNIWEPNHASHSTNLVSYYNSVCKKRINTTTYSDACQPIGTGTSKKTYAMASAITTYYDYSGYNIYDGPDLNRYSYSQSYLSQVNTYKTSDAITVGNDKQPLIKVAGNSVTKVRVYIWLEGQDIDNYDMISQNPSVQVKFGFTKDKNGIDSTNNTAINNRASSFQEDSWAKIKANIQAGTTSQYKVGDMRTIRMDGKEYRLRLANKSTPSTPCNNSSYSKTACGFVVEFVDIVHQKKMRESTASNSGGWPASELYTYLQGDFYNSLPDDLKSVITTTKVVSGHGPNDSSNYTTNDKIYLLSLSELVGTSDGSWHDSAAATTRQLDYYQNMGVTNGNNVVVMEKMLGTSAGGTSIQWWTRTPSQHWDNGYAGQTTLLTTDTLNGVAPAFRIG